MWKDLQVIWLVVMVIICVVVSSWAHGAVECKVAYNNVDTGMMVIQCPPKSTDGLKVGDTIKGKAVKPKKDYEGC